MSQDANEKFEKESALPLKQEIGGQLDPAVVCRFTF